MEQNNMKEINHQLREALKDYLDVGQQILLLNTQPVQLHHISQPFKDLGERIVQLFLKTSAYINLVDVIWEKDNFQ